MGSKQFLIGAILALFVAHLNGFGLEWDTRHVSIAATPEQDSVEALFAFTNNSNQTVTIRSIRSSCGCTVPELQKREYLPGESGEIRALFTFGTRTGQQKKTITVITDESEGERTDLLLEVSIPQLIQIKPFYVFWRKGDTPDTRTIELRVSDPGMIRPVSIKANNDRFEAILEPTDDPAVFKVAITPRTTGKLGNSYFLITTDFPSENPRVVRVYAGIR